MKKNDRIIVEVLMLVLMVAMIILLYDGDLIKVAFVSALCLFITFSVSKIPFAGFFVQILLVLILLDFMGTFSWIAFVFLAMIGFYYCLTKTYLLCEEARDARLRLARLNN